MPFETPVGLLKPWPETVRVISTPPPMGTPMSEPCGQPLVRVGEVQLEELGVALVDVVFRYGAEVVGQELVLLEVDVGVVRTGRVVVDRVVLNVVDVVVAVVLEVVVVVDETVEV